MENEEKAEILEAKEEKKDDFVIPLPEEEKKKSNVKILPPNSKPYWSLRLAAGLIDLCILVLTIMGLYYLINISPISNGLRDNKKQMILIQDDYKVTELLPDSEETYGHIVYDYEESYTTYKGYVIHEPTEEDPYRPCYIVVNNENISNEVVKAYNGALKNDQNYSNYSFNYRLINYGLTILAGTVSTSIFLLLIPLLNKRRATLGKLFAGTQLINSKYQVRAKWYQIVGRYFFQVLIEGALPYLFISGWTILAVPVLLFIISLINKEGRTLHDLVSQTKVIDKRTFLPLSEQ